MARMKKAVQKVLEENMVMAQTAEFKRDVANKSNSLASEHADDPLLDSAAGLRARKLEVEKYQDKARRLVDCMRVPDLTFIPGR